MVGPTVIDAAAPPSKAQAFSTRAVIVMLLVGVGAFVALVAAAAYAPELRSGADGGGHALSRSAIGFSGLARLLPMTGAPVVISRGALPPTETAPGIMIATPDVTTHPNEIDDLAGRRALLVVLPKWSVARDDKKAGWVRKVGLEDEAKIASSVKGLSIRRSDKTIRPVLSGRGADIAFGPVESLQTAARPIGEVWLSHGGRPVLMKLRSGVFLLTDPDLLNNHGLRSVDTARGATAILDILRGGQGPVVFDVTLNGFSRSRTLLRMALEPPFLGASLCALAAALLMGAHAFARFGATRRPTRAFALGKRALVDNAAALIRLARREPAMGSRYAALTRRAIARAVAAGGPEAAPDTVDAALDRLTPQGEAPLSTLIAEAGRATTSPRLMDAARRLHRRRVEMTRERL